MANEAITYTGRNLAEVREWLREHAGTPEAEAWIITKGMTASTGGQAWRYARAGQDWPDSVRAALYDPATGSWGALRDGDTLSVANRSSHVTLSATTVTP